MAKVFTLSEMAKHNTRDDCWVTVFGKVYNVTSFMDEHPGGDEILLNATGRDATDEFDDIGHSHEAWAMLEKFYVGDIDRSTITNIRPMPSLQPVEKKGKKAKYMMYLVQFLLPLVLLNLVVAFVFKSSA